MADKDNKSSNRNNRKDNIKGKQNNTFDMFDINVKKAQQDVKKVFDNAKSQLNDYKKQSESVTSKMLSQLSSQYNNYYKDLEKKHNEYLKNIKKATDEAELKLNIEVDKQIKESTEKGTSKVARSERTVTDERTKGDSKLEDIKLFNKTVEYFQDAVDDFQDAVDKLSKDSKSQSSSSRIRSRGNSSSFGSRRSGVYSSSKDINSRVSDDMYKYQERLQAREDSGANGNIMNFLERKLVGDPTDARDKALEKGMNDLSKKLASGEIKVDTPEYGKALNSLQSNFAEGTSKIEAGSTALSIASVALEALKGVINGAIARFESAVNTLTGTYENTAQQYAVLTNTSVNAYNQYQSSLTGTLNEIELTDNVKISTIMEEATRLAQNGITNASEAQEMAITNSINKTLAPYVDTTTSAYTDLQRQLGTKFTNKITGMTDYLSDISGSARVFKSSINDVIDKLEPVALSAEKDLLGNSYSYVEDLVNSGAMTEKQAIELVSQAVNTVSDPYEALTSGNTAQAAAVAQGKADTVENALKSMLGTASMAGSNNAISQSAGSHALGTSGYISAYTDIDKVMNSIDDTASKLANNTATPEDYYYSAKDKLKEGEYNTAEDKYQTFMMNTIGNWWAAWKEQHPILSGVVSTIGKGIATIVSGKLLSGLFKGFSGGGGISGAVSGLKGAAKSLVSGAKTLGTGAKNLAVGAKNVVAGGLGKAATAINGVTGGAATAGTVASGIAGAAMTIWDGVQGYKKADSWYAKENNGGKATTGQKVSSAIGGAIGGTGKGIGQEGASAKDVAKNTGWNTAKGAAIGAAVGSVIPGVGTAVGAVVGGAAGAISGLIGGERISKAINGIGEGIKNVGKGIADTVKKGASALGKAVSKTSLGKTISGIKDVWSDSSKSFGEKLADSAKSAFKNNPLVKAGDFIGGKLKEGAKSLTKSISESGIGKAVSGVAEKAKSLGSGIVNGAKNLWGKITGSHATGLDTVPSNDYVANLHQGESVLTNVASKALKSISGVANISSGNGMASAITNIIKGASMNALGSSNSSMSSILSILMSKSRSNDSTEARRMSDSSAKAIVDAIYDQTKVLKETIEKVSTNNKNNLINGNVNSQNATSRFTMQPKYDESIINLQPQMS